MKWKARYILMSESLYGFAAGLFGPIYAIFVEKIGGDLLTASWAWSAFAIATGITLYVMGKLEDRIRQNERVVVIGFILASIGFLGYAFVSEPWHLFVVQIVIGFGWAFGTPALDTVYSKNLDYRKQDSEWGMFEASQKIVEGISAFFGGIIAFVFGFKILFLAMFGISIISIFLVFNLLGKSK